jgi:hypothetical protein
MSPRDLSRSYSTVKDIDYQLKPYLQEEAVKILAEVTALVFARDPGQRDQLMILFGKTFRSYDGQLNSRHEGGIS